MKVTIEIDLPEGQAIPESTRILRLTSPDWINIQWGIEDVKEYYEDYGVYISLTDDEARKVLQLARDRHDANDGINWDVLNYWQEHVLAQREDK